VRDSWSFFPCPPPQLSLPPLREPTSFIVDSPRQPLVFFFLPFNNLSDDRTSSHSLFPESGWSGVRPYPVMVVAPSPLPFFPLLDRKPDFNASWFHLPVSPFDVVRDSRRDGTVLFSRDCERAFCYDLRRQQAFFFGTLVN